MERERRDAELLTRQRPKKQEKKPDGCRNAEQSLTKLLPLKYSTVLTTQLKGED